MNNRIKGLIIFVLGAAGGAFGGAFAVKKKYEKFADAEIQDYKEFSEIKIKHYEELYRNQANEIISENLEEPSEQLLENGPGPMSSSVAATNVVKRYNTLTEKKDLDEVMRERGLEISKQKEVSWDHPKEDEDQEEEEEEEDYENQVVDHDKTGSIRLITTQEFLMEKENYDKITLTYYEGDGVLTDERDGIVPSPEDIIGKEALRSFGREPLDSSVVYVRNNKSSCDFEILRSEASYVEAILGGAPQEPKVRAKAEPKPKKRVAIRGDSMEVLDPKPIRKNKVKSDGEE